MTPAIHVRWMIVRDMPEVMAIERASFADPWDEEDFRKCLRERCVIGMIAEVDQIIVGHMIYELAPKSINVLNFAVDPMIRRCGVGTKMVEKLVKKLEHRRRTRIVWNVAESNLDGHLFLRALGFRATKIIRANYDDGQDAYQFRFAMPQPAEAVTA